MTPIHRGDDSTYPSKRITVAASGTALAYLFEYINVLREVANIYGVPVIEMFECGISPYNVRSYTLEGLHPNKAGMMKMKDYVIHELKRII
jgi:lysophospholipase L1-like esterase